MMGKMRQLVLIQSLKYLMLITYVLQGQSGVVGIHPALLDKEDSVMTLKTCLVSPLKRKLRPSQID